MDGHQMEVESTPVGKKRHAEDNLENEQRLAKRFNALKLGTHGKLYFPAAQPAHEGSKGAGAGLDSMQLDDTKNKVYIYNLDDELSGIESEEEKLIFLPDIEKRLTKIPKSVLSHSDRPTTSSEMILYNVPQSLSVPQEHDNVRKAIIETRARARERQARALEGSHINGSIAPENGSASDIHNDHMLSNVAMEEDEDAMDIG
ncbi:MAG: hypothetical protein M1830_010721 [Pleopsidium flavum]|nr:MAG: hypothetical protein M1830_010721 [Pleopsidium flavum]